VLLAQPQLLLKLRQRECVFVEGGPGIDDDRLVAGVIFSPAVKPNSSQSTQEGHGHELGTAQLQPLREMAPVTRSRSSSRGRVILESSAAR